MNKILLTISLCFGVSLLTNAQNKLTADQQEAQKIIVNVFQALADRNLNSLKSYCTEDVIVYESGLIWNMDTLIQKINRPVPADFKRVNKIDFIKTTVKGNTAWVTCYNQADVTANGSTFTRRWLETSILIKVKNQWKLETLHSTLLKKDG
jgi:ketosteroid isomerase-like protein